MYISFFCHPFFSISHFFVFLFFYCYSTFLNMTYAFSLPFAFHIFFPGHVLSIFISGINVHESRWLQKKQLIFNIFCRFLVCMRFGNNKLSYVQELWRWFYLRRIFRISSGTSWLCYEPLNLKKMAQGERNVKAPTRSSTKWHIRYIWTC